MGEGDTEVMMLWLRRGDYTIAIRQIVVGWIIW